MLLEEQVDVLTRDDEGNEIMRKPRWRDRYVGSLVKDRPGERFKAATA